MHPKASVIAAGHSHNHCQRSASFPSADSAYSKAAILATAGLTAALLGGVQRFFHASTGRRRRAWRRRGRRRGDDMWQSAGIAPPSAASCTVGALHRWHPASDGARVRLADAFRSAPRDQRVQWGNPRQGGATGAAIPVLHADGSRQPRASSPGSHCSLSEDRRLSARHPFATVAPSSFGLVAYRPMLSIEFAPGAMILQLRFVMFSYVSMNCAVHS